MTSLLSGNFFHNLVYLYNISNYNVDLYFVFCAKFFDDWCVTLYIQTALYILPVTECRRGFRKSPFITSKPLLLRPPKLQKTIYSSFVKHLGTTRLT